MYEKSRVKAILRHKARNMQDAHEWHLKASDIEETMSFNLACIYLVLWQVASAYKTYQYQLYWLFHEKKGYL